MFFIDRELDVGSTVNVEVSLIPSIILDCPGFMLGQPLITFSANAVIKHTYGIQNNKYAYGVKFSDIRDNDSVHLDIIIEAIVRKLSSLLVD